jgi:hypothetical protein
MKVNEIGKTCSMHMRARRTWQDGYKMNCVRSWAGFMWRRTECSGGLGFHETLPSSCQARLEWSCQESLCPLYRFLSEVTRSARIATTNTREREHNSCDGSVPLCLTGRGTLMVKIRTQCFLAVTCWIRNPDC